MPSSLLRAATPFSRLPPQQPLCVLLGLAEHSTGPLRRGDPLILSFTLAAPSSPAASPGATLSSQLTTPDSPSASRDHSPASSASLSVSCPSSSPSPSTAPGTATRTDTPTSHNLLQLIVHRPTADECILVHRAAPTEADARHTLASDERRTLPSPAVLRKLARAARPYLSTITLYQPSAPQALTASLRRFEREHCPLRAQHTLFPLFYCAPGCTTASDILGVGRPATSVRLTRFLSLLGRTLPFGESAAGLAVSLARREDQLQREHDLQPGRAPAGDLAQSSQTRSQSQSHAQAQVQAQAQAQAQAQPWSAHDASLPPWHTVSPAERLISGVDVVACSLEEAHATVLVAPWLRSALVQRDQAHAHAEDKDRPPKAHEETQEEPESSATKGAHNAELLRALCWQKTSVAIAFVDGEQSFTPTAFELAHVRCWLAVRPLEHPTTHTTHYQISVYRREDLGPRRPSPLPVPTPPIAEHDNSFREFVLSTCLYRCCWMSECVSVLRYMKVLCDVGTVKVCG
jgi:hypothetical protein